MGGNKRGGQRRWGKGANGRERSAGTRKDRTLGECCPRKSPNKECVLVINIEEIGERKNATWNLLIRGGRIPGHASLGERLCLYVYARA